MTFHPHLIISDVEASHPAGILRPPHVARRHWLARILNQRKSA